MTKAIKDLHFTKVSDGSEYPFILSDTSVKQQNKIGKIFKNSKFHFFKIEPKLGKTNL